MTKDLLEGRDAGSEDSGSEPVTPDLPEGVYFTDEDAAAIGRRLMANPAPECEEAELDSGV